MGICRKRHGRALLAPCGQEVPASPLLPLQLLLVHHFGQHFPKFQWPGWGEGVQPAESTAAGLLHSQLTGGDDEEGKPGALSRKSSKMPRTGHATSHWINSTLSRPDVFYTPLYLTYHIWAKLSGFSFMIVKNHQPSVVTGGRLLWNKGVLLCCAAALTPHVETGQGTGTAVGKAGH